MTSNRNFIPMANKYDRVILLVDMDCFYCQVEEKLNPALRGKPLAVVQYNAWRGGGIIAVNYAARAKGVTRHMRGDEAKEQCPDIELVKVPSVREKADLTKYREAGKDVANVLQLFTNLLERASVDEAYLDITEAVNKRVQSMNDGSFELQPKQLFHTYAVGYSGIGEFLATITANCQAKCNNPNAEVDLEKERVAQINLRLLVGASVASEIRARVKSDTGYECSAGIAHNKILAKLVCGINKPNKQTILPFDQIQTLFTTLPLSKIKGLGGKFGEDIVNQLKIRYVGDLMKFTEMDLQRQFDEKNGTWLYNVCRGIDLEAVTPRFYSKSIGCCKKFPGRNNITGIKTLEHWLNELSNEIVERLEKDIIENNRRAKQMVVSFVQELNGEDVPSSRSSPLTNYQAETLMKNALELIKCNTKQFFRAGSDAVLNHPIKFLGISVGKFVSLATTKGTLEEMFANQANNKEKWRNNSHAESESNLCLMSNVDKIAELEKVKNSEDEKRKKERLCKNKGNIKSFLLNAIQQSCTVQTKQNKTNDFTAINDSVNSFKQPQQQQMPQHEAIEANNKSEQDSRELDKLIEDISNNNNPENSVSLKDKENRPSTSAHALIKETLQDSDATVVDYREHYVEYATPTFHKEMLNFTKCSLCNKSIPDDPIALQTHQDYHFAFQISEQQRLEYRKEIKIKSPTSKLNVSICGAKRKAKKSPNTTSSNTKKPALGNITKFLKPTSSNSLQQEKTDKATKIYDNQIVCDLCKQFINKDNTQEHQDLHMAKDLQKQLNRLPVRSVDNKKTVSESKLSPMSVVKSNAKQKVVCKSITQFFTES